MSEKDKPFVVSFSGPCGLCGNPVIGFGFADGVSLCHDPARDCYRLWTVYGVRPAPKERER